MAAIGAEVFFPFSSDRGGGGTSRAEVDGDGGGDLAGCTYTAGAGRGEVTVGRVWFAWLPPFSFLLAAGG